MGRVGATTTIGTTDFTDFTDWVIVIHEER
jgi:hypothetical protein